MSPDSPEGRAAFLKERALMHGFLDCKVAMAGFLETEAPLFEQWLQKGYQADMRWLENNFDLRMDPRLLLPGARSVVCLSFGYAPEKSMSASGPKIARYAYGRDYHKVLKKKLKNLLLELRARFGAFEGRGFVDSAPVHERAWAKRSGLGWIGKNSLLLSRNAGSYFFLAVLVTELEIAPDAPVADHCGSCTRCIDACPTQAIVADGVVDSNRCISYHTIELESVVPAEFRKDLNNWVFGCDICQEVCPWNRFSKPHHEADFRAPVELFSWGAEEWLQLEEETFERVFGLSPLKRAGFDKVKQTLSLLQFEEPNSESQSESSETSSA